MVALGILLSEMPFILAAVCKLGQTKAVRMLIPFNISDVLKLTRKMSSRDFQSKHFIYFFKRAASSFWQQVVHPDGADGHEDTIDESDL
jgi:hypothetical protein